MTDEIDNETPDDGLDDIQTQDPTESDWSEWDGGDFCFPHSAQWFAEAIGCIAFRTHDKDGKIEVLVSRDGGETYQWSDVTKLKQPAKLQAIK